jgi:hypothetical protein
MAHEAAIPGSVGASPYQARKPEANRLVAETNACFLNFLVWQ